MKGEHPLVERASALPDRPGCYLFRGATGDLLYVGKARSLVKRVRSYFQEGAARPPRLVQMLVEAKGLEVIVTGSEVEALILENSLIKNHRPRFNVLLRDDKNLPYLKLTVHDEFPRLVLVRQARDDGHLYFGPYLPASAARRTLRMASRYFQVAPCYEPLDGKRGRPCLYYHMNQCLGPCTDGLTTPQRYRQAVEELRLFLEGKDHDLQERLRLSMWEASERDDFELAAHYRDLIRDMEAMSRKQNFARVGLEDQDYFHYHRDGEEGILQLFQTRGGQVVGRREFSFAGSGSEPDAVFLGQALQQYYENEREVPAEVYVPLDLADRPLIESWLSERRRGRVSVRVPRRGVKAAFLTTVRTNAELAFRTRFRSPVTSGVAALETLREALDLDEPPTRIEGFDISHLQGTHVVASMVVWLGGRPRKGEYRRFKVRTVEGQDDFASLAEVVERRYRRRLAEGAPLPDLLLIDGGRGQLAAAHRGLIASGSPPIPMAALAKREEELFLLGREEPLRLPPASPALRLLQQIRDESHRFAVGYHRQLRSKQAVRSTLVEIPGVGPKSVVKLLRAFGSVRELRKAEESQMAEHVAPRIARAVRAYFDAVGST